ncbi:hypothetical protein [Jannaschia sp. W003]|nr:hypothetical protein [Jannaschia sp. W003]UWQ22353.1 hypothetical protein K3554_04770 [Jannaschia sp. W003]
MTAAAEFAASVSWLGWAAIVLALYGLAHLPRSLREMWRRLWKGRD